MTVTIRELWRTLDEGNPETNMISTAMLHILGSEATSEAYDDPAEVLFSAIVVLGQKYVGLTGGDPDSFLVGLRENLSDERYICRRCETYFGDRLPFPELDPVHGPDGSEDGCDNGLILRPSEDLQVTAIVYNCEGNQVSAWYFDHAEAMSALVGALTDNNIESATIQRTTGFALQGCKTVEDVTKIVTALFAVPARRKEIKYHHDL